MKNWKYIEGAKTGNAGITDKEFNSESEMRRWCIEHNYTYTPVGGGYYRLEDDSGKNRNDLEAHVKAGNKTGNEDKTGAEEFFKQLSDDVKEREKKDDADIEKVGNRSWRTEKTGDRVTIYLNDWKAGWGEAKWSTVGWQTDGYTYGMTTSGMRSASSFRKVYGDKKPSLEQIEKDLKEDFWIHNNNKPTMEKVGNALNWDENLVGKFVWVKDKGQEWKVYVMQDKGDKVYIRDDEDGSQGWVSKTRITGKVGNAIGGGVQSEIVLTETKDGSQYWVEKTSKSGQYAQYNLYYTIGQGKRHAGVFKDKEAAADAGRRIIGNLKTGNVQYHKVGKITIRLEANDDDWTVYDTNGYELKSGKGGLGRAKTWAEHFARFTNKRTGNSAQDDKFAYVMREFDAGKLKTPDGKVVTDPAQAKAIAYSESKKTENGLARARKAMNKGITMWKGNDSAYIKEDGTVSYLENNSFETDKDKFESQESAIKELSKQGYVKK